jgi:hypothetical protein
MMVVPFFEMLVRVEFQDYRLFLARVIGILCE